tara:strand:- start:11 stop:895 length:885 start_codon:yes stop_codon:yes gene_type:complete
MYVFGEIDKSSTVIESNVVNYTQNLNTASAGIQPIKIISGSTNTNYWNSLNVLFYTSGSSVYGNELKFSRPSSNLSIDRQGSTQFLNKYHGYTSSSLITIPSKYYGEKIKEGSFKITDLNNNDPDGVKPVIIDDGKGNLYSNNAHHSQSTNAASSSDNYVGNVFYDKGLAIITETGSWSGSINYSDLVTNFKMKFDSVNTINAYEYNVTLLPQDYNLTTNYSIRNVLTTDTEPLKLSTPFIGAVFTGSDFQPYITTINLYQEGDYDTPVITAKLPKPIKKSDKLNTRFKIKLDI